MGNKCGPEKEQIANLQWYGTTTHNVFGESQIYKDPQSVYFIVKSYQSESKQTIARLRRIARIQSNSVAKLHWFNEYPLNCSKGPCVQAFWDFFSLTLSDLLELRRKRGENPIYQKDLWHLIGSLSQKIDYQLSINNIYLSPQGIIKVFIKPSDIDCKQYLLRSRKTIPAPEELQLLKENGKQSRDEKSQVFRVGIIVLFMAIQHKHSISWKQFQINIITTPLHKINFQYIQNLLVEMLDEFSQELTLLVANMLTQKPSRRISLLKTIKDYKMFIQENAFIKIYFCQEKQMNKTKCLQQSKNLRLVAKTKSQ